MSDVPVLPHLRVPFETTEFGVEAWLREERPGPERVQRLILSQPESYRPMLRRMMRAAAERIGIDDPTTVAEVEASNHAKHLLADGVFDYSDPVVLDPDKGPREQLAQAQEKLAALEQRAAVLAAKVDTLTDENRRLAEENDRLRAGIGVGVDPAPEPEGQEPPSAERAESDALLDQMIDGDLDDLERSLADADEDAEDPFDLGGEE